ncbi:hypothetical protein ACNF49_02695 [Actinomadura sp. ATCC 39365]
MSDDPGYVEARRDEVGPFVRLRWGQVRLVTRERAWLDFLDAVRDGGYSPEPVADAPGWVRAEIGEGFSKRDRPVGWRPKVLEVPEETWSRFVEAVRADVFSGLTAEMWKGNPAAKGREWRVTHSIGGWGVWERVNADGADKDAVSPPPDEEPPLPGGKSSEGRCG